jgi:hypothetical protein
MKKSVSSQHQDQTQLQHQHQQMDKERIQREIEAIRVEVGQENYSQAYKLPGLQAQLAAPVPKMPAAAAAREPVVGAAGAARRMGVQSAAQPVASPEEAAALASNPIAAGRFGSPLGGLQYSRDLRDSQPQYSQPTKSGSCEAMGNIEEAGEAHEPEGGDFSLLMVLKGVAPYEQYRAFCLVCLIHGLGWWVPVVHTVKYIQDKGFTADEASLALSYLGSGTFIGRILLMGLSDKIGRRLVFTFNQLLQAAANFAICYYNPAHDDDSAYTSHYYMLCGYAFVNGWTMGTYIACVTPLTRDLAGAAHLPRTSGLVYSLTGIGSVVGPILAGISQHRTGSYDQAYFVCAWLMVASALLMLLTRRAGGAAAATAAAAEKKKANKGNKGGDGEEQDDEEVALPTKAYMKRAIIEVRRAVNVPNLDGVLSRGSDCYIEGQLQNRRNKMIGPMVTWPVINSEVNPVRRCSKSFKQLPDLFNY